MHGRHVNNYSQALLQYIDHMQMFWGTSILKDRILSHISPWYDNILCGYFSVSIKTHGNGYADLIYLKYSIRVDSRNKLNYITS